MLHQKADILSGQICIIIKNGNSSRLQQAIITLLCHFLASVATFTVFSMVKDKRWTIYATFSFSYLTISTHLFVVGEKLKDSIQSEVIFMET